MSTMLNGFNIEDAKILHIGGRPLNAPEGELTSEVPVIDVIDLFFQWFYYIVNELIFVL